MRKVFFVTSCLIISFGILFAQSEMKKEMKMEKNSGMMENEKPMYACPHHPDMKSEMPGKCSCGMEMTMMKSEMKKDGMKKKKMMKKEMMKEKTM